MLVFIFEIIIKCIIMGLVAFGLGFIEAFFEVELGQDITFFTYFTMGYVGCLIFNWGRLFKLCPEGKRKKTKQKHLTQEHY